MTDQPLFRLDLRAEGDGPPVEIRVRRVLKNMLRSYGLRCVRAEMMADKPQETPPRLPDSSDTSDTRAVR